MSRTWPTPRGWRSREQRRWQEEFGRRPVNAQSAHVGLDVTEMCDNLAPENGGSRVNREGKEQLIRSWAGLALQGRDCILWSRHAIARVAAAGLDRASIEKSLTAAEIIEDYPAQHRPLPDCLVLTTTHPLGAIHVVIAIDLPNDRMFLVTVYRPDPARWLNERTRKPR